LVPTPLGAAVSGSFRAVCSPDNRRAKYARTLDCDETVAGLPLPTGGRICSADKSHSSVVSIHLPYVADIRAMRLAGMLRRFGEAWNCSLATFAVANGGRLEGIDSGYG
jgi:hypothetical protein